MKILKILKNPDHYSKFLVKSIDRRSLLTKIWIEDHSPMLINLTKELAKNRPFEGFKIGVCLPLTWEALMYLSALEAGGGHIACYPSFSVPEVGLELIKNHNVQLLRRRSFRTYMSNSDFIHDTAATIGSAIASLENKVKGIVEQTRAGTVFYSKIDRDGVLRQPVLNLDSSYVKRVGENRMASGLGLIEALLGLHIFLPDKEVLIIGFGNIGYGCALYLSRMGCKVAVFDKDPKKIEEAKRLNYSVGALHRFLSQADIVVNATGSISPVLCKKELEQLKPKAILANMGGFGWDRDYFADKRIQNVGGNLLKIHLDQTKFIYELAAGSLINFSWAAGTDTETMDLVFSLSVMVMQYLVDNYNSLPKHLIEIPKKVQDSHMQKILQFSKRRIF